MEIFTEKIQMKSIFIKIAIALLCLITVFGQRKFVCCAGGTVSTEEYLAGTGMSMQEIEALDSDARQFIAEDLRNSEGENWKVNTDILTLTRTDSEQYTVAFYINVFAFRSGSDHRIYAVYESSTGILPSENDRLFLGVGDGFAPQEYGGQIWYKETGGGAWVQGGRLTADAGTVEGGTFTGRQLGDFQRKTLVKGCVYCHAGEGTGDDNRVTVEYTYEPSEKNSEIGLYFLIVAVTVVIVLILRRE